MRCPSCKETNRDKVIDSRVTDSGHAIRRRRECQHCGRRFTTKERLEDDIKFTVVKRDGSKEPFKRHNLLAGIEHACYKLPINGDQVNRLVDDIEEDLYKHFDREVTSQSIGETVIRHLRRVNQVAYVRFCSVFRSFNDIEAFIEGVREIQEDSAKEIPGQQALFE